MNEVRQCLAFHPPEPARKSKLCPRSRRGITTIRVKITGTKHAGSLMSSTKELTWANKTKKIAK